MLYVGANSEDTNQQSDHTLVTHGNHFHFDEAFGSGFLYP